MSVKMYDSSNESIQCIQLREGNKRIIVVSITVECADKYTLRTREITLHKEHLTTPRQITPLSNLLKPLAHVLSGERTKHSPSRAQFVLPLLARVDCRGLRWAAAASKIVTLR